MFYGKINDFYTISRITGPKHNWLAVVLDEQEPFTEPIVKRLSPVGECRHGELNEQKIVAHVIGGVQKANQQFGTQYQVRCLHYIENDCPPESVYEFLIRKIIEHLVNGGEFKQDSGNREGIV